ncbi:hypothetical protein BUALT_Bualt17G0043900 [Buddleja alternifolia]|uniref:Reverse transcriptase RNase H-like domain-containing protein n=1 Tax=Buddleja alternifolia TaxID=168488 RepID=A0AAV6W468_9LAMI|nr:hypothetical protein BUALT_Bualt17G0043900 [Buddleja alternifolia]
MLFQKKHDRSLRMCVDYWMLNKEKELYVKKEKCSFAKEEVPFSGHVIGHDRLQMDKAKVREIVGMEVANQGHGAEIVPWLGELLLTLHQWILVGSSPVNGPTQEEQVMGMKKLFPKQARWQDFLAEFDYGLEYKLGKENVVADALSRKAKLAAETLEKANINELIKECLEHDRWLRS